MRSMYLAVNKGTTLPKFSWRRYADAEAKTGGIELTTDTMPKNIYGWVMDNRSNFRRDFRIAGIRNNEKGEFIKPDFPDYPPGYPDQTVKQSKKYKRVKENSGKPFSINVTEEINECNEDKLIFDPDEWCKYMLER